MTVLKCDKEIIYYRNLKARTNIRSFIFISATHLLSVCTFRGFAVLASTGGCYR
jgi:hypothetical protein